MELSGHTLPQALGACSAPAPAKPHFPKVFAQIHFLTWIKITIHSHPPPHTGLPSIPTLRLFPPAGTTQLDYLYILRVVHPPLPRRNRSSRRDF